MLGAHDTFVTRCYETRFAQHFMMVITYVNAVNAAKYFHPAAYRKSTPQKFILLELAGKMVRNDEWLMRISPPKDGPSGAAACCSTRTGTTYNQVHHTPRTLTREWSLETLERRSGPWKPYTGPQIKHYETGPWVFCNALCMRCKCM